MVFGLVVISIPNKIELNKQMDIGLNRYGISVNIICLYKLYIDSVVHYYNSSIILNDSDVKTTNRYIKLPMLIDMHVCKRAGC